MREPGRVPGCAQAPRAMLRAGVLALLLALGAGEASAQEPVRPVRPARPQPADSAELPADDSLDLRRAPRTGAPGGQTDSIMEALSRLEGYTVTRYTGSGASFDADSGAIALEGPATIVRQGQEITADSVITFDQVSGVVCGYGNPVLTGEGSDPLTSDQICYDTERRMGMALGARTQFSQNAQWFVHGERVFTSGSDVIYSAGTEFTTCDLEVPHYHFTASRFKMVNDRILVARDVTLSFGDVPVFWLPFLVQSLREGRRSGLLTPAFGLGDVVQTSDRATRQVRNLGFFWAINDYTGAEAALDWRSGDWLAVRGRFDYKWTSQFLQGYVNTRQFFNDDGSRELTLNTDNSWRPGERTQVGVSGRYASSSDFVRRETYDPNELNRTLSSSASVRHTFLNGAALSLGATRDQQLLAERIETTLPSVSLNLPTVSLYSAMIGGVPTELTWGGSTSFRASSDDRNESASLAPSERDSRRQTATLQSSFRFGALSFSQNVSAGEELLEAKDSVTIDTTTAAPLPEATTRTLNWSSTVSYQQDLIGTLRVTPNLSVQGQFHQSPLSSDEVIRSPVTLNFGADMQADIFGFWPGVGPFERLRHKLSPSLGYRFRPEPSQSTIQDSIFGETTRASNVITIGLRQTFEAKRPAEEAADSAGDAAADDRVPADGEPRRLPGQSPIVLLSINTTAVAYDFEAASRGEPGLTTTTITNSITSDLLRNLSLNVRHSLFQPVPEGGSASDREFDPHLEQVSANFGLSGESWLFRVLGLGGEADADTPREEGLDTTDVDDVFPAETDLGMVPETRASRGSRGMARVGSAGTWTANFDYSLQRPRDTTLDENQQVGARLAFQPTENWSVGWSTAYSITDSEFQNHALTLTRSLHRWKADFRIMQAQNGNLSFEFEARLDDLPDLRIPYDQRTRGTDNDD
ncbi:MAG TPA: putative LPS assembly protein LptD [Longimicrobiales bacterium]